MGSQSPGREILLAALRNENTPRPAWIPFVGCHGAALIGASAQDYLRSSDVLAEGLRKAFALYEPDGLPVMFDLQLEAEILGCELLWADDSPPSVVTHPLEEGKDISDLPVFDTGAGRFPAVIEALGILKREIGDSTALYGLVCGPFTLALHLMGTNIFMKMFDHPDYVNALLGYCSTVARKAAQAYLDGGADVIAVVDPMTSQISPEHFDGFVAPHVNQVFDHIRDRGAPTSLFVCGDATRNLRALCRTRCDNVSIDENIPLDRLRDMTRGEGKSFGGNLKLTEVLLLGDEDDARLDAVRCIDIGGRCGFVLAPGCDLPFATPPANLQAVSEMVRDEYAREVAKRTIIAKTVDESRKVELPDFDDPASVHVDVVTLDSASCAPCQYMMDAVRRAVDGIGVAVTVREHRITTREGIAAMRRLGVANIPTICIDGRVAFASIIPEGSVLSGAIRERFEEKQPR